MIGSDVLPPRDWKSASMLVRKQPAGLLLIIILFCACLTVFFWDIVSGRKTFQTSGYEAASGVSTTGAYGYQGPIVRVYDWPVADPASSAYNEEIFPYLNSEFYSRGQFPLWNPYVGCGTPLAANPLSFAFYPPAFFLFLFPSSYTWDWFLLMRLVLAGLLTYAYVMSIGTGRTDLDGSRRDDRPPDRWGAVVAALVFMLSGYLVRYVNLLHINVECFLPGLFLGIERCCQKPSLRRMWLIVVFLVMMILGGNPESLAIGVFSGLCYCLARAYLFGESDGGKRGGRCVGYFLGAVGLSIGLTLFFTLPAIEFYLRSESTHPHEIGAAHLSIFHAITLLGRKCFSAMPMGSLYAYPLPYLGVVPLILACFAWSRDRQLRGYVLFFFIMAVVVFAKVVGLFAINWVGKLPGLNMFYFTKYCAGFYFALAVLAGIGFANLQRGSAVRRVALGWLIALTVFFLVVVIVNRMKLQDAASAARFAQACVPVIVFFLAGAGLTFLVFTLRKPSMATVVLRILLCLLVVELYVNLPKKRADRYDVYTPAPYLVWLREHVGDSRERIYGMDVALIPLYSGIFGLYDVRDFSPLFIAESVRYMKTFLTEPSYPTGKSPIFDAMFTGSQYPGVVYSKFIDLLGVTYVFGDYYLNVPTFQRHLMAHAEVESPHSRAATHGYQHGYYFLATKTPTTIRYSTRIPEEGDVLTFDTTIPYSEYGHLSGDTSESPGSGVRYSVEVVQQDGRTETLFSRTLNPARDESDREWRTFRIDLAKYAGQEVMLIFKTEGDLGSGVPVRALWRFLYLTSWEKKVETHFQLVYDGEIKVYHNTRAMPRAFLVARAEFFQNAGELWSRMKEVGFDPREVVLLEGKAEQEKVLTAVGQHPVQENEIALLPESVRIVEYDAQRVVIDVHAKEPGWLVLTDSYYPGWIAQIDGEPARLLRANGFLRCVSVPEGRHRIQMMYVPGTLYIGAIIAILILAVVCVIGMCGVSNVMRWSWNRESQNRR